MADQDRTTDDKGYLTYCEKCDTWWNPPRETHKCPVANQPKRVKTPREKKIEAALR